MRIHRILACALWLSFFWAAAGPGGESRADIFFRPAALPETLRLDDAVAFPDGTFWIERIDAENGISFESRRLLPVAFSHETAKRLIFAEWPEAHGIVVADFHALAKKLTYPAVKIEFLDGRNEDTWRYAGALVFCDDWTFLFVAGAHADSGAGSGEASGDALGKHLDRLVASLDFAPDGSEWPESGTRVIFPEREPEEWASNETMTALIRIKRELNPGREEGRGAGKTAFRYDGGKMLSLHGLAVQRFAFGTDNPEKFTAERHLAADRRGVVYEADIPGGGAYEPVREFDLPELPGWWGTFRHGGNLLRIGSVREGPYSLYFTFALTAEGEIVAGGVAPFEGRAAASSGLLFTLADDGASVEVAPDPETPMPAVKDGLAGRVGVYFRETPE